MLRLIFQHNESLHINRMLQSILVVEARIQHEIQSNLIKIMQLRANIAELFHASIHTIKAL